MYYDTTSGTYISVDTPSSTPASTVTSETTPTTPTPPTSSASNSISFMPPIPTVIPQTKKDDEDKTMSAKKLAKEMEKWAKNQNQKVQRSISRPIQPIAGFDNFEEENIVEPPPPTTSSSNISHISSSPDAHVSQADPFELLEEEESKMIDKVRHLMYN